MLSRDVMGAASLAALWLNVLLVAGAACIDARPLPRHVRVRTAGAFVVGAVGTSGARGAVRAQCVNVGLREDEDFVVVA